MHRVSVIIPNWNGKKYLGDCLRALRAQTYKDFETIVADNGSADGSIEFIESEFPEVRVIALETNTGFGRAVNAGIKKAAGEIIALLNNDTQAHEGWLENAVRALDENPRAGLIASRVMFMDNRDVIDSAGDAYTSWGAVFNIGHNKPFGPEFATQQEVFGVCASAALARRAVLDQTGLFDENFFAYYEDIDLSYRARLMGWTCLYVPGAVVYHGYSGSTHGKTAKLGREEVYLHLTGVWIKNTPLSLVLRNIVSASLFHAVIIFYYLLARKRGEAKMPQVPFFRFMLAMLRRRREIQFLKKTRASGVSPHFLKLGLLTYLKNELTSK